MEKVETHSDDEDDEATLEELLEKEERLERWEAGPSAQTRYTCLVAALFLSHPFLTPGSAPFAW